VGFNKGSSNSNSSGDSKQTGETKDTSAYNFGRGSNYSKSQMPGISVFRRGEDGKIYLTYSGFARGLDILNGNNAVMDLLPNGRDGWEPQHKDSYTTN